MLKSHQRGDLTPAETKVYYLRFAKVLYEEINGFKRLAANGGTLLSRSYFLKERSLQKRRLTKLLEWVNNWTIHGSASSLLCPFSYQGKVNILENEWIRRRDLPIFRRSQGHNDKQQGRMFFHSLHDPVFKSLSSAIKEAIFGKSLLVYPETIRQVAKIDHAQGQIQCSNTCTLFFFQNLFSSSWLS